MAEENVVLDRPNSVKFSVNAKGLWSGEVKVYSDNVDDAFQSALLKADLMADLIRAKNKGDSDE